MEERQRDRGEESARNRPLNENVIRGSRNKAEKPGEERGRRGCGGEGAVVACGQGEITKKKEERERRLNLVNPGEQSFSIRRQFRTSESVLH